MQLLQVRVCLSINASPSLTLLGLRCPPLPWLASLLAFGARPLPNTRESLVAPRRFWEPFTSLQLLEPQQEYLRVTQPHGVHAPSVSDAAMRSSWRHMALEFLTNAMAGRGTRPYHSGDRPGALRDFRSVTITPRQTKGRSMAAPHDAPLSASSLCGVRIADQFQC